MEKLLANKGISTVAHNIEWERGELFERYFFNEKMASKNIFIYVHEEKYIPDDYLKIEEDEDVEDEEEGAEEKNVIRGHPDEENIPVLLTESGVSILTYDNIYAHEFVVYSNEAVNSVGPGIYPMMIYRMILDLVEIMDGSADNIALYENIKQCSTGSNNSKELGSPHWRRHVQLTVLERIQRAQQLIKERSGSKK